MTSAVRSPVLSGLDQRSMRTVAQSAIADRDRLAVELAEDRPDDARREDDLGARRLQPDDRPAPCRVQAPVTLDLSIDLWPVQDRSLDDIRIVAGRPCFTAARFVTAPPIATIAAGRAHPSRRDRSAADGRHRLRDDVG